MSKSLSEIAKLIGAELQLKTEDKQIVGLAPLNTATSQHLSFLSNSKYQAHLAQTQAGAVIISPDLAEQCPVNALIMQNPYLGFAKAAALFDDSPKAEAGIHAGAAIDSTAEIDPTASIGPFVSIGKHVKIGAHVSIGAGCAISDYVSIQEGTCLKANVSIYHKVKIGKRCIIHSGAVIGSDGFGLANDRGRWVKIPQLGAVNIGDEVEIGANTTIDRGALEDTQIHSGAKIDNQVQVAHNVVIGENSAIAAQAGIAGSSKIGKYCLIGGAAGINGHITIGDKVSITAMSGVSHSIPDGEIYSASMPAREVREWNKTVARINRLDKLMQRVKALEAKLFGGMDGKDE
ncbi:MAG: UDP-3-O-acylglucosamine N-acyltransferase [Gammaproteobacteria bacterium]|jgi:UDP-3-O-[3-hydroxymyristoyl] glucosamine N-acyltransferase|nr:UDP-3-O-acylglucosamine N-acyltransferase [Gammaproteobacteria bacterium]